MKTMLIKILKSLAKFLTSFCGVLFLVFAFMISLVTWGIVVNFVYDHQWIVLPMDVFVAMLFAVAMKKTVLSGRLSMDKDKVFMLIFMFSIVLLILSSFGALWNFIVMMFLFPIFIVVQMNLIQKKRSG